MDASGSINDTRSYTGKPAKVAPTINYVNAAVISKFYVNPAVPALEIPRSCLN